MSYNSHAAGHWNLTEALRALDGAEAVYCPADCNEIDCPEHNPAPDGVLNLIAIARQKVREGMVGTLAALVSADPIKRDNHGRRPE